ncbi:MAG: hypothetical protein AAFV69_12025 [Pseudomonadota bacterium]
MFRWLSNWRSAALAAGAVAVLSGGALAAETTANPVEQAKPGPETGAKPSKPDALLAARYAAVDGKFEECAKLADEARRSPRAVWRAHNVFATCEVFAADAVKDEIGPQAYVKRIQRAIDAFNFLLNTPGVLVAEDRRRSIRFMIDELDKRIAKASP